MKYRKLFDNYKKMLLFENLLNLCKKLKKASKIRHLLANKESFHRTFWAWALTFCFETWAGPVWRWNTVKTKVSVGAKELLKNINNTYLRVSLYVTREDCVDKTLAKLALECHNQIEPQIQIFCRRIYEFYRRAFYSTLADSRPLCNKRRRRWSKVRGGKKTKCSLGFPPAQVEEVDYSW